MAGVSATHATGPVSPDFQTLRHQAGSFRSAGFRPHGAASADSQDAGRYLSAESLTTMSKQPHTAIRVISLPAALERRQAFTRSAVAAGCEWEFFDAHTTPVSGLSYDEK